MPTDNNPSGVVGVSVVEEHGVEYGPEGAMPWTSVYVKLLVAFRRQALRKLKGAPLSVFICLALHVGEDGYANPSIETIMQETGYGRATVCSALDVLYDLGLVERVKRYKQSNKYYVRGYAWFGRASQPALFEEEVWSSETELQASGSSETELQEGSGVRKLNSKISDGGVLDLSITNDLRVRKLNSSGEDGPSGVRKLNSSARQVLHERGVGEPTASELAALPHVTPGYVRAWFLEREDARDRAGTRKHPWGIGYLVTQMRQGVKPAGYKPEDYEYELWEEEPPAVAAEPS
jgi:DNA-binding transcriptional ArsR family regulator